MRGNLKTTILFSMLFCMGLIGCSNSISSNEQGNQEELSISTKSTQTAVDTKIQEDVVNAKNQVTPKAEEKLDVEENELQLPPEEKSKVKPPKKSPIPQKNLKPKVTFEETIHDFEEINTGDVIEVKFNFENTGNAPLVVKSATATCGCTVPSYPFIPIEPGDKGFIGVTYNSVGKSGEQKPSITIFTNADPAKYVLHLQGQVLDIDKKKEE